MASLFVFAILALIPAPIPALPIASGDELLSGPKPVFQPDPAGRGTTGLLISCSTTFIICIWTSLHADIPPLHATDLIRFKYKAVWTIVSAAIPEGLIMCALGQWLEARRIREVWKKSFENSNYEVTEERKKLSMEEAFFVVMGGFTVCEMTDDETIEKKPVYYTSTLTPDGFKYYVEKEFIDPRVFEKRHISDKGKGSNIAKAVACLQILWLVIQCIARKIEGLPLTLLEIHVVIQVACTIVTYALWWFKPLDVQQPILITLGKPGSTQQPMPDTLDEQGSETASTDSSSEQAGPLDTLPLTSLQEAKSHYDLCIKYLTATSGPIRKPHYITRKGPPQCLPTIALAFHDIVIYIDNDLSMMLMESLLTIPIGGFHAIAWHIHFPTLLECWLWRASSIAMCSLPICIVSFAYLGGRYQKLLVALTLEMSFVIPGRFKDLPYFLTTVVKKIRKAGQSWDYKVTETRQSKSSGEAKELIPKDQKPEPNMSRRNLPMIVVCLVLIVLYVGAVVFITVESYISLRSPPDGAFLTPKWSNFMPHL